MIWRSSREMRRRWRLSGMVAKTQWFHQSHEASLMAQSFEIQGPSCSRRCLFTVGSFQRICLPSQRNYQDTSPADARDLAGVAHQRVSQLSSTTKSSSGSHPLNCKRQNVTGKPLSISDASRAIAKLRQLSIQLEPLPPVWVNVPERQDQAQRLSLFRDTLDLLQLVKASVRDGKIRPLGKHGRELSHLLGNILYVFHNTPPSDEESAFRQCSNVLDLLNEWNLDIQPDHYEYVIVAASRERFWKVAANLFSRQIDPDAAGYTPMEVSCLNPVGLYAIARHTKEQGGAVAEQVMDAVLNMSMVSPTDQDKYVLAAGMALGLAGEWKSCVEYIESSYNSSRLGQPLVAAAMYACILCSRHNEALTLFTERVGFSGNEWQWGGGSHSFDIICRDLAMCALGGGNLKIEDASSLAVKLFRGLDEGEALSIEALKGVVTACERDGNWEDAVAVFYSAVDRCNDPQRLVSSDELLSLLPSQPVHNERPSLNQAVMGEVLCSVMRNCNASSQFGFALLCSRLIDLAVRSGEQEIMSMITNEITGSVGHCSKLTQTLLPLIFKLSSSQDVLVSLMVSLCGLGCSRHAAGLYLMSLRLKEEGHDENEPDAVLRWPVAAECYRYAQALSSDSVLSLENPWESAHRHIHRLTAATHDIAVSRLAVSPRQKDVLLSAVARAMRCCTAAGHPEVGKHLAKRVEDVLHVSRSSSAGGVVSTLLGLGKWTDSNTESDMQFLNDSTLAETIRAHRALGAVDDLIPSIPSELLSHRASFTNLSNSTSVKTPSKKYPVQSANEALRTLTAEEIVEYATSLDSNTNIDVRNPETFLIIARGMAKEKQWHHLEDIYARSLTYGCLSDELALMAMKSIVGSDLDGKSKLRALRSVISDTAQLSGMTSKKWQYLRYWTLKRALGWHHTRLLMWWNNRESSGSAELQLAVNQFSERKSLSLKPKNDVMKCIVNSVREFSKVAESDYRREGMYQLEQNEWNRLFLEVLDQANLTPLCNDPWFVNEVALAFRALNCNIECIDYLRDAVYRGIQLPHTATNEAIHAAEIVGDDDVIILSDTLFGRAEANSKSLARDLDYGSQKETSISLEHACNDEHNSQTHS